MTSHGKLVYVCSRIRYREFSFAVVFNAETAEYDVLY